MKRDGDSGTVTLLLLFASRAGHLLVGRCVPHPGSQCCSAQRNHSIHMSRSAEICAELSTLLLSTYGELNFCLQDAGSIPGQGVYVSITALQTSIQSLQPLSLN